MDLSTEQFAGEKYKMGYIFEEATDPSFKKYLIITFSAMNSFSPVKHLYSFGNVLSDIPANKLYLQDSLGEFGTYYMCWNMDFSVADTVQGIIEKVRTEHNVEKKNCILLGSSKGGTSALYHAIKGNYGHVLAMGPQTRLGYFLAEGITSDAVWNDMTGSAEKSKENEALLDSAIENTLRERKDTVIHLLSSPNDNEYATHVKPLLETYFDPLDPRNDITIDKRIQEHSDLPKFNPQFVRSKISKIFAGVYDDYLDKAYLFSGDEKMSLHLLDSSAAFRKSEAAGSDDLKSSCFIVVKGNKITVSLEKNTKITADIFYKYELYVVKDLIEASDKTKATTYTFEVEKPGNYRIKYLARSGDIRFSAFTNSFNVEF